MRRTELTVMDADLPPRLDEFAIGRELADAARCASCKALLNGGVGDHSLAIVAVGHVDVAVRSDDDVGWLVELAVGVARLAGCAEAEQLLTLRAELVDLVSLRAGLVAGKVGHPHVAVIVRRDTVRRHHHAFAEIRQHSAGVAVELEDGIDRVGFAVDRAAARAAGGTGAAALVGPDVAVCRVDVDAGGCAPGAAGWQLAPIARDVRRWVGQPLAADRIARGRGCRRRGSSITRPAGATRCKEERGASTNNEACDS